MPNTSSPVLADTIKDKVAANPTQTPALTSLLRNDRFITTLGLLTWLVAIAWIIHSLRLGVNRQTIIVWPTISMLWSLMWWCKGK